MPRKKSPKTLSAICIAVICNRSDNVWSEGSGNINNYFPSLVVADVIKGLRFASHLNMCSLTVLMNRSLQHLDLHYCNFERMDTLPDLIGELSPNLESLNLSGCQQIPPEGLSLLAKNMRKARFLDLRDTQCDDTVVPNLGSFCPDLEELNITDCEQVSDAGFLCDEPKTRFQKLKRLYATYTAIEADGAAFILKSMPCLEKFDYFVSQPLLDKMCGEDDRQRGSEVCLQLRTVNICGPDLFPKLPEFLRMCPYLHTLSLVDAVITDGDLVRIIPCLKQIRELTVHACHGSAVSFAGGVLPILKVHGNRLNTLTLYEIPEVDVSELSTRCVSLTELNLCWNTYYREFELDAGLDIYCKKRFANLETLRIAGTHVSYPSEQQLLFLLGNATKLRYLFLDKCKMLDRYLFYDIAAMNPLERLEEIHVEYCNGVTEDCLKLLLDSENELRKVRLYCCNNIYLPDVNFLNKCARTNNQDVHVELGHSPSYDIPGLSPQPF